MIVTDCSFQIGAVRPEDFPRDGLPQIAFMGRSNVGKSSLINRLLGSRGLARVSKTPGRTRAINFFRVNERIYFVDLPGYGYARVPAPLRREWKGLVEAYLEGEGRPDLAIQLVDVRHDPTGLDLELLEWLRLREIPHRVVMTKADKLSRARQTRALSHGAERLGLLPGGGVSLVSAMTGEGIPELWRSIDGACAARRWPSRTVSRPEGGGTSDTHHAARALAAGRITETQ
ncbi:MAG TPA: ribosome biogenesis GTP-binding protein YihA/YsxC [Candidatus Polarisedimenticolia bacterium]|nr:ribosome biogenesis GTP-binding protein YihA/YsxC [Candidatus Polarisedimenticolia bacterium]